MPWCEECAKYWTPNSMNDDGTCPSAVASSRSRRRKPPTRRRRPWHFKLMVAVLVVYLGWRFVQMVT